MAKYLVKNQIVLVRGSDRVKPEIGKPFEFTDAEVASIKKIDPTAISTVDETPGVAQTTAVDTTPVDTKSTKPHKIGKPSDDEGL